LRRQGTGAVSGKKGCFHGEKRRFSPPGDASGASYIHATQPSQTFTMKKYLSFPILPVSLVLALLFSACTDQVTIPPAASDAAPVVNISNLVIGGKGAVNNGNGFTGQNVTSNPYYNTKIAYCDKNTDLLITCAAKNPGGVKDLSIIIKKLNGIVLYAQSFTAYASQGKGPDIIRILNETLNSQVVAMKVTVKDNNDAIFVEVDSHNFNNQETHYVGEYLVR
jgi:hypothetical protein